MMNKQEKEYLYQRIKSMVAAARRDFTVAHPTRWEADAVKAKLQEAGFVLGSYAGDTTLPLTEEMQRNRRLVERFNADTERALRGTQDSIFLGDADALQILADFATHLEGLSRQ